MGREIDNPKPSTMISRDVFDGAHTVIAKLNRLSAPIYYSACVVGDLEAYGCMS